MRGFKKSGRHRPHKITCHENKIPVFGQASYGKPLIVRLRHPKDGFSSAFDKEDAEKALNGQWIVFGLEAVA
jgi:hypothetical protein